MKNIFLYIILFFLVLNGYSQNKTIDSLKQLLKAEIHDTTKINLQLDLSNKYISFNIDSFNHHTNKAYKLSLLNGSFKLANVYNHLGLKYVYGLKVDSAHYYFDEALKILDKKDDRLLRSTIYANYATSFEHSDDFKKKM